MAKTITGRILGGVNTPLLAISNDQVGRTIQIGNNWQRIAIGIRFGLVGSTTLLNCGFALGMCNGTTNMFKSATTNNFFGIISSGVGSGTATFGSNTFTLPFSVCRRVTTTNTVTAVSSLLVGNLDFAGGGDGRLHTLVVQLTRNGSTIDFTTVYANNTLSGIGLQSRNDWINTMEGDPLVVPANPGYGRTNTTGFAVDEATNGPLDTVNISWSQSVALHIADIGVCPKRE
jgi:hypothetical protein